MQLKPADLLVGWLAEEIRSRKEFIIAGRAAHLVAEGFDLSTPAGHGAVHRIMPTAVATSRINSPLRLVALQRNGASCQ